MGLMGLMCPLCPLGPPCPLSPDGLRYPSSSSPCSPRAPATGSCNGARGVWAELGVSSAACGENRSESNASHTHTPAARRRLRPARKRRPPAARPGDRASPSLARALVALGAGAGVRQAPCKARGVPRFWVRAPTTLARSGARQSRSPATSAKPARVSTICARSRGRGGNAKKNKSIVSERRPHRRVRRPLLKAPSPPCSQPAHALVVGRFRDAALSARAAQDASPTHRSSIAHLRTPRRPPPLHSGAASSRRSNTTA